MKITKMLELYVQKKPNVTLDWQRRIVKLSDHLYNLATMEAENVTSSDISFWLDELKRMGFAAKTIHGKHGILTTAYSIAIRDHMLSDNPCIYSNLPKIFRREMSILTKSEYRLFLDLIDPGYKLFIKTAFSSGARFGELTALTRKNLFVETCQLFINQSWSDHERILSPGKTDKARRSIPLPKAVMRELVETSQNYADNKLLFTNRNGTHLTNQWCQKHVVNVARNYFLELNKPFRFHDIRHTYASWLLADNTPVFEVSRYLGHKSVEFTMNTYGHLIPGNHFHIDRVFAEMI
jgi:integrase